jgi:hypothetical protein
MTSHGGPVRAACAIGRKGATNSGSVDFKLLRAVKISFQRPETPLWEKRSAPPSSNLPHLGRKLGGFALHRFERAALLDQPDELGGKLDVYEPSNALYLARKVGLQVLIVGQVHVGSSR